MILDEPTNHLDRRPSGGCMDELERFPGAILVVSHDLKLLDRSINKVLHICPTGGCTSSRAPTRRTGPARGRPEPAGTRLAARAAGDQAPSLDPGRLHAGQHESGPAWPSRSTSGSSDIEAERDRGATSARRRARSACPPRRGPARCRCGWRSSAVRYGDQRGARATSTSTAGRGDRIVIIGRNGAGKSSLLRCLAGVQEPDQRRRRARRQRRSGLLRPGARADRPRRHRAGQHRATPCWRPRRDRRALLARSGCRPRPPTRCRPPCRVASGRSSAWPCCPPGEANVLLLDEPTNNLDPSSIAAVGTMLGAWPGTIVAVSHDRAFVEALRADPRLQAPRGGFTHWQRRVPRRGRDALWTAGYDTQIWVGPRARPRRSAMALEPCSVVGLAKFCTLGLAIDGPGVAGQPRGRGCPGPGTG